MRADKCMAGPEERTSARLLGALLLVLLVPLASCQTPSAQAPVQAGTAGEAPKPGEGPAADKDLAKEPQPEDFAAPEARDKDKEPPKEATPLPAGVGDTVFSDDFAAATLDEAKWVHTVQNDFEKEIAAPKDGRLQLAASSVGTDDKTVKFHGVRTKDAVVDMAKGTQINYEVDWSKQSNGCYMTTGIWICPTEQDNPRDAKDSIEFNYIGVPPGKTARGWVTATTGGINRRLMTEGWPNEKTGREIGLQKITIKVNRDNLVITENDKVILEVKDLGAKFDKGYLYLQHSTHSNYRLRSVFFDNVVVKALKAG